LTYHYGTNVILLHPFNISSLQTHVVVHDGTYNVYPPHDSFKHPLTFLDTCVMLYVWSAFRRAWWGCLSYPFNQPTGSTRYL